MRPTEIPINYLSESLRFVVSSDSEASNEVHAYHNDVEDGAENESDGIAPDVDNYKTEIWLDCNSYAANAQYTKSKIDMEEVSLVNFIGLL